MQNKKLTGWLILLIVWMTLGGINGIGALGTIEKTWRPLMAEHPSLETAVIIFQLLTGAGIVAWLYAAWTLYRREPGTLSRAQMSLVVGGLLRLAGSWSIIALGGLPKSAIQRLTPEALLVSFVIFAFTYAWSRYLTRSQKVREIYADYYTD